MIERAEPGRNFVTVPVFGLEFGEHLDCLEEALEESSGLLGSTKNCSLRRILILLPSLT